MAPTRVSVLRPIALAGLAASTLALAVLGSGTPSGALSGAPSPAEGGVVARVPLAATPGSQDAHREVVSRGLPRRAISPVHPPADPSSSGTAPTAVPGATPAGGGATGPAALPTRPETLAGLVTRLDLLSRQGERLSEQLNAARLDLAARQAELQRARAAATSARLAYETASAQLSSVVLHEYEAGPFSSALTFLTGSDAQGYLDGLSMLNLVGSQRAAMMARLGSARDVAAQAEATAERLADAADVLSRQLTTQQAQVATQQKQFEARLASLGAAQRAAYVDRMAPLSPAEVKGFLAAVRAPNARAQAAVDFALRQVGKPYVFAAAGPDAFDCSGLTMAAWAAGGVALPHLAAAQILLGKPVTKDQLLPGDLIFLYPDVGHVMIYVGNGLIVNASEPGVPLEVISVDKFAADWVGARRYW